MKILLILTTAFDQGGTQNDMIQLSSVLKPLGYDIHLAAPKGSLEEQLAQTGGTFHPVPSPVGGLKAQLAYTKALAAVVRKGDFDLLAPQSIRAALATGLLRAGRVSNLPIVTSLHNLHNPGNAGLAAKILSRCCDLVTFENHYERRLVGLQKTSQGRTTRVVYSGVDLDRFSPRPNTGPIKGLSQPRGKLAGCVARLSPEKDHQTLLRAWSIHTKAQTDDHLILIGDGPCRPQIERSVALLELGTKVSLLGERNDVDRILPHLDLFVLSSSRESYPRSAREALACGVPVILPGIGGCGEIVSKSGAGSLFRSGDPADLARLLSQHLAESSAKQDFSQAARRHAELNFPLEMWRDTMDGLYRRFGSHEGVCSHPKIATSS